MNQEPLRPVESILSPVSDPVGRARWILLGLAVLGLVLLRNQPWNCLVGYDQAKQAFVSLEMVQDGRWWYQHLPTGYPATKPPLAGWLSATLFPLAGGWWELAWRAPSLIAFFAILFVLGRTAWRVGREWAAFLAMALFAINMLTIRLATLVRTDMFLALTILCGGLMIWRQIRENQPWPVGRRLAFALIVLAGCFTKGPVILVYLLLPLLVWRMVCWRRKEPSHAWTGWWPWLVPVCLLVAWLIAGCLLDPQFFRMVVVKEFGTNFAAISVTDGGHVTVGSRRFGMMLTYPLQLLHRLFPWSAAALLWLIVDRQGRRRLMEDAGARWLIVWTGVALILMSLVPNKRVDRIFPVVAPFALLTGHMVAAATWTGAGLWRPAKIIGTLTLMAVLIWGGYTVYWQLDARNPEKNEELARYELCLKAEQYAREAGVALKILGPISDRNQSLLTYLRCTVPVHPKGLEAELARGNAVLMPIPGPVPLNDSWHVVFQTDRVTGGGSGYGLVVGSRSAAKP